MFKKMSSLFTVFISILFIFLCSTTIAAQKNFSKNHAFPNESLEQLIDVLAYDNRYDQVATQAMIDRMAVFPERIIEESLRRNISLLFIDFPLTELPEYEHLAGEIPRGWESTGSTWDDVPGAGGLLSVARIGYSEPGEGHSSINLEYHEFGHAVDDYMLGYPINELVEFNQIHVEEKPVLFPDDEFNSDYMDNVDEYFAETIAMYYLGGEERTILEQRAPKTHNFMATLYQRILSVEQNDEHGIAFSWEKIVNANQYEIYRDEELIGTTRNATFTDVDYESYTYYSYVVKAISVSGELLNETFIADVFANELGIPEAPSHFTAVLKNNRTVSLAWEVVLNANGYEVLRNDKVIATTTRPYFIDNTIRENKLYQYTVQARNRAGISKYPSEIEISTMAEKEKVNHPSEARITSNQLIYYYLLGGILLIVVIVMNIKRPIKK